MKRKEYIVEISKLDAAGLKAKARALREEIMKLQVRHASAQLQTPHRIGAARRDLARVLTRLSSMKA